MAELEIKLSTIELNVDETATIYTFDSPRTYLFQSTPELIEAGVSVQTYGVITVPTDATLTGQEIVEVEYVNKVYSALLSSIISAEEGDEISFSSLFITVEDLADVEITDIADGQTLIYDASSEKWVNGNVASGGSDTTPYYNILINEEQSPVSSITLELTEGEAEFTENCNFGSLYDLISYDRGVAKITLNGEVFYLRPSQFYNDQEYGIQFVFSGSKLITMYDGEVIVEQPYFEIWINIGSTTENNYASIGVYDENLNSVTLSFEWCYDIEYSGKFEVEVLRNAYTTLYCHESQLTTKGTAYDNPAPLKYMSSGRLENCTMDILKRKIETGKPARIVLYNENNMEVDVLYPVCHYAYYTSAQAFDYGFICFDGTTPNKLYFGVHAGGSQ